MESSNASSNGSAGAPKRHLVIGGGPAGLTAGYYLAKRGEPVLIVEADDQLGGIAKTKEQDGYRFDLGGHRFFTKAKEVDDMWHEVLDEEFLERPRMSRIYWNGKFLDYPLKGPDVIKKLGPIELTRAGLSYLKAAIFNKKGNEENFEQWVTNRFGKRLFDLFFKSYTEKVWGVPTNEIRAEWAAQRIKGLSFFSAAKAAFFGNKGNIKTLIDKFNYPRYGPGQLWDAMAREIEKRGGEVRLNATAERIVLNEDGSSVKHVIVNGEPIEASHVISSLPLRNAVGITEPAPGADVQKAAKGLRYRDFLTVGLVIDGEDLFPDNWIYIHEPDVRVGRIQNYRSWSPWMVPDESKACVGLEYFCFEGDDLWTMSDDDLVKLATKELAQLGLADPSKVEKGYAVRVPKAYPMYDEHYDTRVDTIKDWLAGIDNLHQVGRNGLHRYNNSDHSSLTAIRTVENICDGTDHDIWAVNAESVYHETHEEPEQPYKNVPEPPSMEKPLADVGTGSTD